MGPDSEDLEKEVHRSVGILVGEKGHNINTYYHQYPCISIYTNNEENYKEGAMGGLEAGIVQFCKGNYTGNGCNR